jgi:hypothetical protein
MGCSAIGERERERERAPHSYTLPCVVVAVSDPIISILYYLTPLHSFHL